MHCFLKFQIAVLDLIYRGRVISVEGESLTVQLTSTVRSVGCFSLRSTLTHTNWYTFIILVEVLLDANSKSSQYQPVLVNETKVKFLDDSTQSPWTPPAPFFVFVLRNWDVPFCCATVLVNNTAIITSQGFQSTILLQVL